MCREIDAKQFGNWVQGKGDLNSAVHDDNKDVNLRQPLRFSARGLKTVCKGLYIP